jgi:hypothetical protein
MKSSDLKNHDHNKTDICFYGLNFTGSLMALSALKSGLTVTIVLDQPLHWEYEPEVVTLYPLQLNKLFLSKRRIRFFAKISSLFPSLVYPLRILAISEGSKIQSKTINLIDTVLKRDRDIASLPIVFEGYADFHLLKNQFGKGLLVQELRFDRNMAIIEVLRKCREAGAQIVSDLSAATVKSGSIIKCLPYQIRTRTLRIENFQLGFKNNLRIFTTDFEITTQVIDNHTDFYF